MKNAIILHGMPEKEEYFEKGSCSSKQHWLQWLKHELEIRSIAVETPEMPEPYTPNYEKWKQVFEQLPIDEETVLVGHSCGAGFLVRWLSENKLTVGKVILVAPWIDPDHEERELVNDFFDFTIDPDMAKRTKGITIFISNDDDEPILKTVEILKEKISGIKVIAFSDRGHFTQEDMDTIEFPELLEEVVGA